MPDRIALIRPIPDSFDQALVQERRAVIDVGLARAEHDEYRRHLEAAGYAIEVVPRDDTMPDSVFIEDTAVVVGGIAVITRPGAESRRAEIEPVASALDARFDTTRITAPGTLDGGDVFIADDVMYVGRSTRTNAEGVDQLRAVAYHQGLGVVTVGVNQVLHLKSAVLPVDEETVVVTAGAIDEDRLRGLRILYEDPAERHRFSALPLGEGKVLVTANAPATAELLAKAGYQVVPIEVSQIQAADGGLTCMSILL